MKLIILALLITSFVCANENDEQQQLKHNLAVMMQDKSVEMENAEMEYSLWTKGLNKYLFDHSNPNVRVLGVQYLIQVTESLPEEYSTQIIENQDHIEALINDLINEKDISPQALIIIESICQSKSYTRKCDEKLLSKTRIELEPDNVNSYLSLLERALHQKDIVEIAEVLAMMAQTKYNNHHYYVIPELEQAIRDYEKQNPFPQSYLDTNKQMYDDLIGLSDSKLQDMFDNMQEYSLFGLFIGYKLALPMPYYRSIMTSCESMSSSTEDCLKIAKILQNKSYSILGTVLGNAIELKILESSEDQDAYQKLKQQDESFRNGYMCLSQSLSNNENNLDNSFNLEYYHIANKLEREEGELASLMKQAELNYQYQMAKKNKLAIDPKSCFKH
jgi:hypothetical protein